jgi:AcrR family transcriptional regulator
MTSSMTGEVLAANAELVKESGSYHHGDLRNALVAAGRRVLEENGVQELSLRFVARSLGVSQTAPARHFDGKEGLLIAIATDGFNELAALRRKIAKDTPDAELRAYRMMASYVKFAQRHKGLFNLMVGPRIASREAHPDLATAVNSSFDQFAQAVCEFARSMHWPEESMHLVTHASWAVEHGVATLIIGDRIPKADRPVKIDPMIDFSIKMMLNGIRMGPQGFGSISAKLERRT